MNQTKYSLLGILTTIITLIMGYKAIYILNKDPDKAIFYIVATAIVGVTNLFICWKVRKSKFEGGN